MKLSKSVMSTVKYILWTAIAAGMVALTGNLDQLGVSTLLIPIVAAILKGIATYIQSQVNENNPDKE